MQASGSRNSRHGLERLRLWIFQCLGFIGHRV